MTVTEMHEHLTERLELAKSDLNDAVKAFQRDAMSYDPARHGSLAAFMAGCMKRVDEARSKVAITQGQLEALEHLNV